jgi:hypothetical protein
MTTVVFSTNLRDRLFEALKNPMPVKLLSTFVKSVAGSGGGETVARDSPTPLVGITVAVSDALVGSLFDSSIGGFSLQQHHTILF